MAAILVMMLMMTWQGNPLEAPNIAPTRSSAKKNDWSYGTLKLVFDAFCIFLWVSDNTKFKIVFPKKETIEALNVTKGIPKDIKWPLLLVVERHRQTEWIIVQLLVFVFSYPHINIERHGALSQLPISLLPLRPQSESSCVPIRTFMGERRMCLFCQRWMSLNVWLVFPSWGIWGCFVVVQRVSYRQDNLHLC